MARMLIVIAASCVVKFSCHSVLTCPKSGAMLAPPLLTATSSGLIGFKIESLHKFSIGLN